MIREPVAFGLALLAGLVVVSPAATARAQGPEVSETAPEDSSENGGSTAPESAQPGDESLEGVDDIDDVDLAELLGMDLDEQLGTTEAVSRADESILRAPATLTTIDSRRIRHSAATSIPELLRGVPGVQVVRNAAGNYLVSLRGTGGLTGNNLVVMLDGVPLNSPIDSSVDWDLVGIAVQDIERIEVVRGPVSTIYGADAYTGVINIVSRQTTLARHAASVRGAGGTDLGVAPVAIGSASYVFSGERATIKWFGTGRYDDTNNIRDNFRHPPLKQAGMVTVADVMTGEHSRFHAELGGSYSERSSLDQLVLESHPTERGLVFGALGWSIGELPSVLDTVDVWARSRAQIVRTDPELFNGFNYTDTNAVRSELGVDIGFDFHRMVRGRIGGQGTVDYIEAPYLHPAVSGTPRAGAAFHGGLSIYPHEHLDLNIHARGDLPPVLGKIQPSFRTSIVYHRDRWSLRLAGAAAFRSPSYVEAGGQFRDPATNFVLLEGNPGIQPPRQGTIEIGSIVSPINSLTIRPTVYVSAYSSQVIADFDPLVQKTYKSEDTPRWLLGAELELDWDILDELSLTAAGGYLRFLKYDENTTPLVGVPEQNSSWTGMLRLYGTTTNERYGYGIGGNVASPRSYLARAGIPPQIIDVQVPYTGYADGRFEFQPALKVPIWLSATARAGMLPLAFESPFPLGAQLGAVFMLGVEWRRE